MKRNGDTAQSTPCSQHPLHTQPCECWSQLCHNTKGYFPTAQHQCCSAPLEDGFGVEGGILGSSLGHCHYRWAAAALGTVVFCRGNSCRVVGRPLAVTHVSRQGGSWQLLGGSGAVISLQAGDRACCAGGNSRRWAHPPATHYTPWGPAYASVSPSV